MVYGLQNPETGFFCTRRHPACGDRSFLYAKPRIWRGFLMVKKKPPKPKLKRFILPTLLQVVEAISQQFKDVMHTYTNHHEVPRMFQKLQHAWPSRSWAMPPARLSRNTRAFGIT